MKTRIKEFREMLGMSKAKFAEEVGLTQMQLNNYERGLTDPTLKTISKIAAACKVNPAWLVGWSENINPGEPTKRVCYVSEGPSRIPPYLDTDATVHTVKWVRSKRPYLGKK